LRDKRAALLEFTRRYGKDAEKRVDVWVAPTAKRKATFGVSNILPALVVYAQQCCSRKVELVSCDVQMCEIQVVFVMFRVGFKVGAVPRTVVLHVAWLVPQ